MSEARAALNVPKPVQTNIGGIAVHTLSVSDSMVLVERFVALAEQFRHTEGTGIERFQKVLNDNPNIAFSFLSPATNRPVEELEKLDLPGYLDVLDAFLELHEGVIERFLRLRDRFQGINSKVLAANGEKSSTPSTP